MTFVIVPIIVAHLGRSEPQTTRPVYLSQQAEIAEIVHSVASTDLQPFTLDRPLWRPIWKP